jgi:hypothetical protein
MQSHASPLSRRAFNALALSFLPTAPCLGGATDRYAQFTRDLVRSYELQSVALDMEDVENVFRGMRDPLLCVGVASTAVLAAQAALRTASSLGSHSLVVIAVAPGEGKFRDYKFAYNTVRDLSAAESCIIYSACNGPSLPAGSVRVSLLTG